MSIRKKLDKKPRKKANKPPRPGSCLVLNSGGVNSLIAKEVVSRVNPRLRVRTLSFTSPFWVSPKNSDHVVDMGEELFEMIKNPKYGVGGNQINPCIDCKLFMLKKSLEIVEEFGYNFVVTGDVASLASSKKIKFLDEHLGKDKDLIVRPLSAATISTSTWPEKTQLVFKKDMYRFRRDDDIGLKALAEELGVKTEPNICGCLLLNQDFRKIFLDAQGILGDLMTLSDIKLLIFSDQVIPVEGEKSLILVGSLSKHRRSLWRIISQDGIDPEEIVLNYDKKRQPLILIIGEKRNKERIDAKVKEILG